MIEKITSCMNVSGTSFGCLVPWPKNGTQTIDPVLIDYVLITYLDIFFNQGRGDYTTAGSMCNLQVI